MTEASIRLGDVVLVRRPRRRKLDFAVVRALFYKPTDEQPKLCGRVRWANIRNRKAVAILTDGRKAWGADIDPVPRD